MSGDLEDQKFRRELLEKLDGIKSGLNWIGFVLFWGGVLFVIKP